VDAAVKAAAVDLVAADSEGAEAEAGSLSCPTKT